MSTDFYLSYIKPHAAIIIKICRAYSYSNEDFEDYYQEVCLQIWKSRENFKGNSQWSTWIYRIALNVCLSLSKNNNLKNQTFSRLKLDTSILAEPNNNEINDEDINKLYDAIKQLSEIDRAIILLYLEEKKYFEIAEIIGTNANNIGVRIKRIKQRLYKLITKNNESFN